MRLLFVSDNSYNEEKYRNALSSICERDSIFFVYSLSEARNYIQRQTIKYQSILDGIIYINKRPEGHDNITSFYPSENYGYNERNLFLNFIRFNEATYSNFDFNLNQIPVALIMEPEFNRSAYTMESFGIFNSYSFMRLENLSFDISSSIKQWRIKVLNELDNLCIKYNSGKIDYSYYLNGKRKKYVETIILGENFKLIPRKLNYDWLISNEQKIAEAIDKLIIMLKKSERSNAKADEKRFHKLFNKYPELLKRDNYSQTWYEAELPYGENNYWEPDYMLKPNLNYKTDLTLIEVKLPQEGFLKRTKFHSTFLSKVFQHLTQINDYKDYLENANYKEYIRNKFGFVPNKVEYNLLIGRLKDKEDNTELLEKRMRQFGQQHINLLSYDELLEYQVKYLDRMKLLELR